MPDTALPPLVTVDIDGPVATLTLNRPDKRNAISVALLGALDAAIRGLTAEVKVIILAANGEHFCAGLDLAELALMTPTESLMNSRAWYDTFARLQFGPRPVVAVLHGAVVGGGLELASSAHVRVAERSAYFGLPEGQRGIFLGGGGSVRVSKLIGFSRVTEMMLTGRVYNADEGFQIGLVHHAVAEGQGLAKARELAQRIASNAPMSNFAILQALPAIAEQPMEHGLLTESLMAALTQSAPEARARVEDFLAKRAGKVERG